MTAEAPAIPKPSRMAGWRAHSFGPASEQPYRRLCLLSLREDRRFRGLLEKTRNPLARNGSQSYSETDTSKRERSIADFVERFSQVVEKPPAEAGHFSLKI